ncbi:coproporphyrinogen III oxidase [Altericroceibacterium spongiae]|uniref:Heme chaperone HemW n=1 Tax=Altericroceibacterium spongiae TaxID=2320269 RepID=A0A420ES34_9SPHN|nr:radical SAM family heme chaperone HemW [Altericroceibacterium spongiae]RKF23488.1 coproporphyrinogen III oxidase [Altericroceibacterium spongiae]
MARALYIHWPFCLAKCPYCDFNSHVRNQVDTQLWENSLLADMRHEAAFGGGEALHSIFFGGGTPSLMPPALVARLLQEAEQLWGFTSDIEVTLEANPSSVEAASFASLAEAGINRLSLGIQSLDDSVLRFLGRLHNGREALAALDIAQTHFRRVSFDLIYARPEQTIEKWTEELKQALSFGTEHLSLYQLTIEPGTRFATDVRQAKFAPMEDDPAADLFALTREMTAAAGLPAYEISNHAKPGAESRHNLTYWRYQDYCGIGPGAHGRRNGQATQRHRKPENWLSAVARNGHGTGAERNLTGPEQASEALLMGLRLAEGVDLRELSDRFGIAQSDLIVPSRQTLYRDLGFLDTTGSRLRVTEKGMPLLDALLGELVPDKLVAS